MIFKDIENIDIMKEMGLKEGILIGMTKNHRINNFYKNLEETIIQMSKIIIMKMMIMMQKDDKFITNSMKKIILILDIKIMEILLREILIITIQIENKKIIL